MRCAACRLQLRRTCCCSHSPTPLPTCAVCPAQSTLSGCIDIIAVKHDDGSFKSAIVKFSLPLGQAESSRWADLLVAEFHAHEVLAEIGLGENGAALIDAGNRRFLEIPRFDRVGDRGRQGVVSLDALVRSALDEYGPSGWVDAAARLKENGWVSEETVHNIAVMQSFGELIGNSDMHYGNLVFGL